MFWDDAYKIPVERNLASEKQMNILIFNWRDIRHNWAGGSEIYIFELAKRWVQLGNKVTLFCAQDIENNLPDSEYIQGIHVIRKGGRFTVYLWAIIYYFSQLRKSVDIIVDVENGIPFFTPLFSLKPKICLVYHVHGKQFFFELPKPLGIIGFLSEKYVFPLIYINVPIIAISKTTKESLIQLGFKRNMIHIIYAGVAGTHRNKSVARKFSKPTILYLGRIKKYKRIDLLVRILPEIIKKFPRIRLIIAGWGTEAPSISDKIMKGKMRKYVDILGPVNEREKQQLLQKSWIFINPSIHEGWGISIIESNKCGTPAIAFRVPGLSDSIRHGITGLLCKDEHDMIEKILFLLGHKTLRATMSRRAIEWADHFNWDSSAVASFQLLKKYAKKQ